ncbi:MBL fold metallo-hydrolase [Virgibacillus kekensis]|uniref:MBL fold metallo-hydrolase n=1 Tax=Virgibacillus kekensis TaxID=202261 RepID=A0ABV9DN64_9BACI
MTNDMHYGKDYKVVPATSTKSGTFEKIAEDLWYQTIQIVNLCYVTNPIDNKWVLIDAGMPKSANNIIDHVTEKFGKDYPPAAIVLTHGHFDHVGGLVDLVKHWNVPVYAHEKELPYLRGEQAYPEPDTSVEGGMVAKMSKFFPTDPIELGDMVKPLPADGSVPYLEEWKWIHTPGHTPGHVSFWREKDQTLIVGDAFVTVKQENLYDVMVQNKEISGPPRYLTPDWKESQISVEKLRNLHPKLAITGHGLPMEGEDMTKNLDYLAKNFKKIAVPDHGRYVETDKGTGTVSQYRK